MDAGRRLDAAVAVGDVHDRPVAQSWDRERSEDVEQGVEVVRGVEGSACPGEEPEHLLGALALAVAPDPEETQWRSSVVAQQARRIRITARERLNVLDCRHVDEHPTEQSSARTCSGLQTI